MIFSYCVEDGRKAGACLKERRAISDVCAETFAYCALWKRVIICMYLVYGLSRPEFSQSFYKNIQNIFFIEDRNNVPL